MQEQILLIALGLFGGFYGTSVGGVGLIVVPVLIFMGLSAQEAVATTLFSYMGIMAVGLHTFHFAGKVNYRVGITTALLAGVGAVLGSFVLLNISNDLLTKIISASILFSLALIALKDLGLAPKNVSSLQSSIGYILVFILGIISGFVVGGIAIMASYILVFFFGQTFIEAAATRKILFLPRTTILVLIYAFHGLIVWHYGIPMLIAEGIGAYFGTHYALKKGNNWVRILFMIVAAVSAVKLLV